MPEFSDTIISLFQKRAAAEQGGLLNGQDPSAYNTSDPLRLWIIQLGVIMMMSQLLSLGLSKLRQPKVIAEVIGGIILGPTALGRIPGFTEHIFPLDSRPYLSLVANIGLCLFLFLVGLEIDTDIVKRNARLSAAVALGGMILPFGFGAGLSVPLYHHFIDPSVVFTHFMLFTGVAYSITAFPVLCRILTELKLLDTTVGIVVLSAGVGNDIVGWILLALSVALVNAGSGLTALWILLCCVAWALFLLFPVKIALRWMAVKTGSIERGPTMFFMTITIILLFGSAFFTDVIGVQAIFGAFLVGLIVPREGGLAISLVEKIEDIVQIVFLPLYFTLSGLSTNLGLLNNGITWGYTIAILSLAFTGKFGGCTIAARYFAGFNWREASAIGSLMSCKGLVELIVLNVGLSAGILSQRVFSMFVLEALTLTFMTTPLVSVLYPPDKRVRIATGGISYKSTPGDDVSETSSQKGADHGRRTRFTVVLDKIDHLPGMMALTQLVQLPSAPAESGIHNLPRNTRRKGPNLHVDALRLIELSDRTSDVMKSSVADTLLHTDPLLGIFKMFGELNNLPITSSLAIVPYDDLGASVAEHALNSSSEMIFVPWLPPYVHRVELPVSDGSATPKGAQVAPSHNPLDILFKSRASADKSASAIHSHFVRGVFAQAKADVALFVDQGHTPGTLAGGKLHIYLPFFGGPDDRLALEFVVQLCCNPRVSATVVKVIKKEADSLSTHSADRAGGHPENGQTVTSVAGLPDTVYGNVTTQTRMQSETADQFAWGRFTSPGTQDEPLDTLSTAALTRIKFTDLGSAIPLHAAIQQLASFGETNKGDRIMVVTGRSRRLAVEDHKSELKDLMQEYGGVGPEVSKTIGDVATAFVVAGCGVGVVVVQASNA